jgi:NADP-dependent 3-hydroxy acid dehydrogenase YdfG
MLGAGYFRDRTVLITGASSGIGRDIAMSLSRMGAQVAMLARRKALLDELKRQVESAGARALALGADVTHASEVRAAVDRTLETFGAIDILVNSAGVLIPDNVESMDPADLERMMGVNLYGTVHAMQAVLPSMRARSRGNIVNIASLAGRRGLPPLGGYCATKFAVVGLTRSAPRGTLWQRHHSVVDNAGNRRHADGPGEQQQEARAARQHYCDAAAMGNVGGDRGGRAGSSRG